MVWALRAGGGPARVDDMLGIRGGLPAVVRRRRLRQAVAAVQSASEGPDKIVLVFGSAHGSGIFAELQQIDPAWQRTK